MLTILTDLVRLVATESYRERPQLRGVKTDEDEMTNAESNGTLTVAKFCVTYNIGRTKFYQELNAGRIAARKLGSRTLIERSEADRWLRSLPIIETTAAT